MNKTILALCFSLLCAPALGQVAFPKLAEPVQVYANEAEDWNVSPATKPKLPPYHAKTPTTIPGARVIKTMELKGLLAANKNVVVIDVLDSKDRRSVPGASWMHGAGDGQLFGAERSRFAAALEKLTGGDKARPLVFLCLSSECWLSYNASLHALDAGYRDVIWYRGGTDAWRGAGQKTEAMQRVTW